MRRNMFHFLELPRAKVAMRLVHLICILYEIIVPIKMIGKLVASKLK